MNARLVHEVGGLKTFVLVFDTDDEAIAGLTQFARENRISGAHLSAIGAFREALLGYFDWPRKDYRQIALREQVEVLSLLGDVALDEKGEPKVHAHVVVGRYDGTAWGGHLLEGQVRPTLEVTLVETPAHLRRRFDSASRLALIRP